MSKSAWCDLNSKVDVLKLQDICPNPRGKSEKQNTFTLIESPFIGKAVSSKTKNSKFGEVRSKFLKTTSWGTVLNLTDMKVYGIGSEVMWSYFK